MLWTVWGRLNTMTDLGSSSTIISGATYGPSSELLSIGGSYNETRTYNSMLQLLSVAVAPYGSTTVNMSYAYSSTQNNGKITSQTDNISGETVVYTYDSLNRLATAGATSSSWGQSYGYDGFGNLASQTVTAGSAPAYSVAPDPTTNHVGSTDANGNSTDALTGGYPAYDVMNRLVAVGTGYAQYSYAPSNKRVWRGIWTSSTLTTDEVTFWSISGQKLATYSMQLIGGLINSSSATPQLVASQATTNYYFGGKLIKNGNSPVGYVGSDRVGSIGKYYPYGQEKPSATTNGTEKFTGYVRDSETGLDYAVSRYHNPGTGRFLTADPYRARSTGAANPKDPGSWNRYSYVQGDPVNFYDPRGLFMSRMPPNPTDPCFGATVDTTNIYSQCFSYDPTDTDGDPGGDDQGPPGGGGAASKGQTAISEGNAAAKFIADKTSWSPACDKDLTAVGTQLASIQTAALQVQFSDGTASGVTMGSLLINGTDPNITAADVANPQTVAGYLQDNPPTSAVSQLGGNNVYLNPNLFTQFGNGYQIAIVMHELLHNATSQDDGQLQDDLGLPHGPSKNVTLKLLADCFLQ